MSVAAHYAKANSLSVRAIDDALTNYRPVFSQIRPKGDTLTRVKELGLDSFDIIDRQMSKRRNPGEMRAAL